MGGSSATGTTGTPMNGGTASAPNSTGTAGGGAGNGSANDSGNATGNNGGTNNNSGSSKGAGEIALLTFAGLAGANQLRRRFQR